MDAIRHQTTFVATVDASQHDREFISAQAGKRIGSANDHAHASRGLQKRLIASGMAEGVVNSFEAIQIQKHIAKRLASEQAQIRVEAFPVKQSRQVVGGNEMFQLTYRAMEHERA